MNKQESQNLMIGSWVLAEGKPRQVHSLTTKKAGFKRGANGQRDFFRFDQLRGIPLSEEYYLQAEENNACVRKEYALFPTKEELLKSL